MSRPLYVWALGLTLLGGATVFAGAVSADDPSDFAIHTARMEGAAVNVRESADMVARTAGAIADSRRIQDLALLMSQMTDLNRRVVSAHLAAEVMSEE